MANPNFNPNRSPNPSPNPNPKQVRLAMLLFRSIYTSNGTAVLETAAELLLSALGVNPHVAEARDLL